MRLGPSPVPGWPCPRSHLVHDRFQLDTICAVDPIVELLDTRVSILVGQHPATTVTTPGTVQADRGRP